MIDNHSKKYRSLHGTAYSSPYRMPMKQERSVNCWDFMKCRREPGGELVAEKGMCPAAVDAGVDGINGGRNGGRCCWSIAGTFCFGVAHGTSAKKYKDCMDCGFYWTVAEEETDFISSLSILRISI
jgi:hypothetical protein